jgi:hypothetical protein
LTDALQGEKALAGYHLLPSVRGDLLAKLGRNDEAACGVRARGVHDEERARKGRCCSSARKGGRHELGAGPGRHEEGRDSS